MAGTQDDGLTRRVLLSRMFISGRVYLCSWAIVCLVQACVCMCVCVCVRFHFIPFQHEETIPNSYRVLSPEAEKS